MSTPLTEAQLDEMRKGADSVLEYEWVGSPARRRADATIALVDDYRRLRALVRGFCETIDHAEANMKPKTGMQVPYLGDFANITPSVLSSLSQWRKAFREAPTALDAARNGATVR